MAKSAAKKKAAKPSVKKQAGTEKTIKYADKSAGQPEMAQIFEQLVKLMAPFEKGSLARSGGSGGQFSLASKKQAVIAGKAMDEVWFCGALVQKGYVGFYYMPVYIAPEEIKPQLAPGLLKCLKGKSCFHIKKLDEQLKKEITDALQTGAKLFRKKGWID